MENPLILHTYTYTHTSPYKNDTITFLNQYSSALHSDHSINQSVGFYDKISSICILPILTIQKSNTCVFCYLLLYAWRPHYMELFITESAFLVATLIQVENCGDKNMLPLLLLSWHVRYACCICAGICDVLSVSPCPVQSCP